MEILTSQVFGDILKNVIIGILIGSFEYCIEKIHACSIYGSINGEHLINLTILMRFTKPSDESQHHGLLYNVPLIIQSPWDKDLFR